MITVIGTVDNDAVLERLAAGELAEAGRLVVISVEAIRQKVGPRWGVKEPTIWEFAHREFKGRGTARAAPIAAADAYGYGYGCTDTRKRDSSGECRLRRP